MSDFIQMCSDFFDALLRVINHTLETTSAFFTAIGNIYTGLVESIGFFPSFLGGMMLSCAALLILLRVMGR